MGFREDLDQEQVRSLPLREAIEVRATTPIRDAVALMRSKSLGCAVIVEYGGAPAGIFTEKSLVKVMIQGASLDDRQVGDFADPDFLTVTSSDPISRVWDAIQRDGLRFVCVTEDEGKLIGITGQRGVAEYVAEYFAQQVVVQRLGSTPWMQHREGA